MLFTDLFYYLYKTCLKSGSLEPLSHDVSHDVSMDVSIYVRYVLICVPGSPCSRIGKSDGFDEYNYKSNTCFTFPASGGTSGATHGAWRAEP
jgi:hypothetical protein